MISQTAEYALRAAVYLAGAPDGARTTQAVSEATGVPPTYLSKILRLLNRAGLVTSQRGPRGGFLLAGAADRITALDIIDAVDPFKRMDRCPLDPAAPAGALCPLHTKLARTISLMEDALGAAPLSELVGGRGPGPGCRFPGGASSNQPTVRSAPDKEETR